MIVDRGISMIILLF